MIFWAIMITIILKMVCRPGHVANLFHSHFVSFWSSLVPSADLKIFIFEAQKSWIMTLWPIEHSIRHRTFSFLLRTFSNYPFIISNLTFFCFIRWLTRQESQKISKSDLECVFNTLFIASTSAWKVISGLIFSPAGSKKDLQFEGIRISLFFQGRFCLIYGKR